jgi:hypothetical protein
VSSTRTNALMPFSTLTRSEAAKPLTLRANVNHPRKCDVDVSKVCLAEPPLITVFVPCDNGRFAVELFRCRSGMSDCYFNNRAQTIVMLLETMLPPTIRLTKKHYSYVTSIH